MARELVPAYARLAAARRGHRRMSERVPIHFESIAVHVHEGRIRLGNRMYLSVRVQSPA